MQAGDHAYQEDLCAGDILLVTWVVMFEKDFRRTEMKSSPIKINRILIQFYGIIIFFLKKTSIEQSPLGVGGL